ncbi:MAG: mechanosensitive ion channel family protein [Phormidesmis sp.]
MGKYCSKYCSVKGLTGFILGLAIALMMAFSTSAQLIPPNPNPSGNPNNAPAPTSGQTSGQPTPTPKPTINRLLPNQLMVDPENIDAAPIYLDGRTLFRISAPAVESTRPAEVRAQEIQRRLNTLTQKIARQNSSQPKVTVDVDEASSLPIISVNDQQLLTVTSLDAQLNSYASPALLAQKFAEDLRTAFQRYLQERSPAFLQRQAQIAISIIAIALLLQLGAGRIVRRLKRRQARLTDVKTHLGSTRTPNPVVDTQATVGLNTVFDQIKARLDNRQKRKLNETAWGMISLLQALLWAGSLLGILSLFPYSRWLTTLSLQWLEIPAKIFLLCGLASILIRLSGLVIDRVSLALRQGVQLAPDQSQRLSLRFSTFSQSAKGLVGVLILAATGVWALAIAGVQVAPLLAGAGIAGIGVSLAAQSLIKDLINGFLILLEDHFGIGDVVSISGLTGSVEYINLRITQLRDTEGRLITIPNSQIDIVQNLSKDWAQVDLQVTVSPESDLNKVIDLLQSITTTLSEEAEWQRYILEPPELLGVEALDYTGVTLRLFLKTQPLKQWAVARELRRRIRDTFEKEGIDMGLSQGQVIVREEEPEEGSEAKEREGEDVQLGG